MHLFLLNCHDFLYQFYEKTFKQQWRFAIPNRIRAVSKNKQTNTKKTQKKPQSSNSLLEMGFAFV